MNWTNLVYTVCGSFMTPNLHIIIEEVSKAYEVDKFVILSVIWQESRCKHTAVGAVGELGLMQISPIWHLERMIKLDARNMFNTEMNISVGVDLLSELNIAADPYNALAIYNGGYLKPPASKKYAKNILSRAQTYKESMRVY